MEPRAQEGLLTDPWLVSFKYNSGDSAVPSEMGSRTLVKSQQSPSDMPTDQSDLDTFSDGPRLCQLDSQS